MKQPVAPCALAQSSTSHSAKQQQLQRERAREIQRALRPLDICSAAAGWLRSVGSKLKKRRLVQLGARARRHSSVPAVGSLGAHHDDDDELQFELSAVPRRKCEPTGRFTCGCALGPEATQWRRNLDSTARAPLMTLSSAPERPRLSAAGWLASAPLLL